MKVEVRLFAQLREKLPDAPRGRDTLEIEDGASLADLLETLDIPSVVAAMVLVNGERAGKRPEQRAALPLAAGDVVAVFPALAGG